MRHERELCCDDLAVRHCGDAIGYARALTRLERIRVVPEPAVAANGGSLLYRIHGSREREASAVPPPACDSGVIAAALCIPLTMHRAHARPEQTATRDSLESAAAHDQDPIVRQRAIESLSTQSPVRASSVEYPAAARGKGITGTVIVEATLDAEGNVADARVISGPVGLRKAALRSVLEWQFANTTAGEVRQVSIDFNSNGVSSPEAEGLQTAGAERRYQTALTLSFMNYQIEQLRGKLADMANQPEIAEQLKGQIADQESILATARRAMMLQEDQINPSQRLARQVEESSFAAAGADRDAERDQRKAGAMNALLGALQRQLASKQLVYTDNHPEVRAIKAKIADMQQAIMKFVAGRKLIRIDGDGLPASFHLPVELGDTLTEDSMNAVVSAVNAFDPNLEAVFVPVTETEAAIRIIGAISFYRSVNPITRRHDHRRERTPRRTAMRYDFLIDTYETERIKVISAWSMFEDDDLPVRPNATDTRGRSLHEHMVHQCVSEDIWFRTMLDINVGAPPLPKKEVRLEFLRQYEEDSGKRLVVLRNKDEGWWEGETTFFDVRRSRAWVMTRRMTHTPIIVVSS